MKILFLTSRLPYPPCRGDCLRAFHFIRHFSQRHDLHLLSFIADESERKHIPVLLQYCKDVQVVLLRSVLSLARITTNIWRSLPLQTLFYQSPKMQKLVDDLLKRQTFDLAYIQLFRMAPYLSHHPEVYRVADLTDVISKEIALAFPYQGTPFRLLYRFERPRIERYERWIANTFEETWLISEAEKKLLAADCPKANLQVVTNGVDTDVFFPSGKQPQSNSLIFVGHMGVLHNRDAAKHLVLDIFPRVRRRIPSATLNIVGSDPTPDLKQLEMHPGVTVTGFVQDLNALYNTSAVFVAPLRFAAGVQNKCLEAMATARAMVTTSLVNKGLQAEPGVQLLIADDAESSARQILVLLQDVQLRARIGAAAFEFVQNRHTWPHCLTRLQALAEKNLQQGE